MKGPVSFLFAFLSILFLFGSCLNSSKPKMKVFGWTSEHRNATLESLTADFADLKKHGLTGVCHGVGGDVSRHETAAQAAHANGLEYQACMVSMLNGFLDSSLYVVNRNGDNCYRVQPYVGWYKFLCPSHEEVYQYFADLYGRIADLPSVDGVHLDFIRFPDVILARGLWDKYGLTMEEEYPVADYCYCDLCTEGFRSKTGIDIKTTERPDTCREWVQYRYDLITNLVNRLATVVHSKGKKISAAVFPGPELAKKLVRQEWNKWEIDEFFPMNYNDFYLEDAAWVGKITEEEVVAAGDRPVVSGLFICHDWKNKADIADPEGHGLLPSEIKTAVTGSMEAGAAGVSLFTPGKMTPEHWEAFEKTLTEINKQ
jgi:hypothetical protein